MVEHEQKGAFNIHVSWPFDLETIRLLSGGHSVPLEDEDGIFFKADKQILLT